MTFFQLRDVWNNGTICVLCKLSLPSQEKTFKFNAKLGDLLKLAKLSWFNSQSLTSYWNLNSKSIRNQLNQKICRSHSGDGCQFLWVFKITSNLDRTFSPSYICIWCWFKISPSVLSSFQITFNYINLYNINKLKINMRYNGLDRT
jgi:hypothetical protein